MSDTEETTAPAKAVDPLKRSILYQFIQNLCRFIVTVFFRFRAYDTENVPAKGAVILASNHQSYLDPILVTVAMRRPIAFFANAYLFRTWPLGALIRNLHAFPVERGKGDRAAVATAIAKLKLGYAINMFPEGTRSPDGQIKPLERGIALLARKGGALVVPMAIDGAFDAWPKKQKLFRLSPVHVIYGKPIDPSKMDATEFLAKLDGDIRALHARLISRRAELRN